MIDLITKIENAIKPFGFEWLLRHNTHRNNDPTKQYFCNIYNDNATIRFTAYAVSPESALRQAFDEFRRAEMFLPRDTP